jgi:thiamine biosynthesis lipoprotein
MPGRWFALVAAILLASAPAPVPAAAAAPASADTVRVTREEARYVMGTVATVSASAPGEAAALSALDAAWAAFAQVDAQMSTWRADSDLSRVNAGAAAGPVEAPRELLEVVAAALSWADEAGGAFDPTVLPLLRAWGLQGGEPREPTATELARTLAVTGARHVQVDTAAGTIAFTRAGVALDLGGIAKGYALDGARAAMVDAGATAGVLDLGGNLLVFGHGERQAAIVAPDDPQAVVGEVTVGNGAVATSGQYERFVDVAGRRRGHILDARTGLPVVREGSVTVVAPTGLEADALSTALFVLGPDKAAPLLARHPGASAVFVMPLAGGGWELLGFGGHQDEGPAPSRHRPCTVLQVGRGPATSLPRRTSPCGFLRATSPRSRPRHRRAGTTGAP